MYRYIEFSIEIILLADLNVDIFLVFLHKKWNKDKNIYG